MVPASYRLLMQQGTTGVEAQRLRQRRCGRRQQGAWLGARRRFVLVPDERTRDGMEQVGRRPDGVATGGGGWEVWWMGVDGR